MRRNSGAAHVSAEASRSSGYRRDVPDRQSKRWLPDDALVAATDWLWLGQTLGELVEPLFAEGRLEAWVFAPAGVPDEDLKSYSGATNATDASSAWWESPVQYN